MRRQIQRVPLFRLRSAGLAGDNGSRRELSWRDRLTLLRHRRQRQRQYPNTTQYFGHGSKYKPETPLPLGAALQVAKKGGRKATFPFDAEGLYTIYIVDGLQCGLPPRQETSQFIAVERHWL